MADEEHVRINPNEVDEETLRHLPGVGSSLAKRIVKSRPYGNAEDLKRVRGISDSRLEAIQPYLVFDESSHEEETQGGEPSSADSIEDVDLASEVQQTLASEDGRGLTDAQLKEDDVEPVQQEDVSETSSEVFTPSETGSSFSRIETLWLVLGVGLLAIFFSVLFTLLIIGGINRTLDFNRATAVRELQAETDQLADNLTELGAKVESIDQRLEPLEGLSGRMSVVEGQVESLQLDIEQALVTVEAMQSDLDQLSTDVETLSIRMGRFDVFLGGLNQLLDDLFPETPSESVPGS
ncbi:MAG: hypothetical protein GTO18_15790 [Anaerolineales bacterium]|nr:hypothetical protein [Anaerolineales bacterium]